MLAEAKWFSTVDMKSGHCQVDLHDLHTDDEQKTAFSTGQMLWQFTIMPFGLCNAPATSERLMETALRGLTYDSCFVYLNDVVVIGIIFQEHLLNLRKLFRRLREARPKINPEKCQLFQDIRYPGHTVSPEGITMIPRS
jgi:hypothetical protein